jgi:hypothetical protein
MVAVAVLAIRPLPVRTVVAVAGPVLASQQLAAQAALGAHRAALPGRTLMAAVLAVLAAMDQARAIRLLLTLGYGQALTPQMEPHLV